jgi:uncharacterized membrane protein
MWLLGAIGGAVLGAAVGGIAGFFLGGLIGGLAGGFAAQGRGRLDALEKRVAELERSSRPTPAPAQAVPQAAAPVGPPPPPERQIEVEPVPAREATEPELPPAPATASAPSEPEWWERLVAGNLVAKVGILVLFFGIAFLIKYAYERIHVPIELRLTGVAIGALVLLVIGWRLRESRRGYALVLQGGGIAILYLVVFAAFRLFSLLPAPLAFVLLAAVAAASAGLAVLQNALTLAVVGVTGGFLAPILASTGQGNHVILFSYYAVLNAGIVAVAWLRAWRVLNVLGFAFTSFIGLAWGAKSYRPELFASTEPFIALFFAMYIAIPLLFARRRVVELKDYVDGTLVFGLPVVAFGMQAAAIRHIEYGAAWSAFFVALVYLALASALFRRTGASLRLLVESYIALSLAFATLAVPLAFDGRLTSAVWALEGAAIAWVGTRQGRLLARAFGYALQFAAGLAFLSDVEKGYGSVPVLNSFWLGCTFIAAGALFCAGYMERNRNRLREQEQLVGYALLAWGALWWYAGGVHEIARHVTGPYRGHAMLMFVAASSVGFALLSTFARWPAVRWLWLLLYPAMAVVILDDVIERRHPFAHAGAVAWIGAFAVHFALLARQSAWPEALVRGLHAAGVWLLALVCAREVGWLIDTAVQGKRVWPSISWAIVPAALLLGLTTQAVQRRWPVSAYRQAYVVLGGAPLALFLAVWTFYANASSDGDPYPLPFVPLLNPLDVAIAAAFLVLVRWLAELPKQGLQAWWDAARPAIVGIFGFAVFVWLNASLLRTLHHWAGLPFALQPMLSSTLAQAALSILWTLVALIAMTVAARRALRPLWILGAALMGVVVAKLFLVELSGVGTVERIVSFIVVGLLMLLVGYLSPMPPKASSHAS